MDSMPLQTRSLPARALGARAPAQREPAGGELGHMAERANAGPHASALAQLRAVVAPPPAPVAQRIEFETEAEAIQALRNLLKSGASDRKLFPLVLEYLEYAQEMGWDDLEDLALPFVRRVEDEGTARVLGEPSQPEPPSVKVAADPVVRQEGKREGKQEGKQEVGGGALDGLARDVAQLGSGPTADVRLVRAALEGLPLTAADYEPAGRQKVATAVAASIKLYQRVLSILELGVLSPTDLQRRNVDFTPSSDQATMAKVSLFDVDDARPGAAQERFSLPGHQSIGPVLERRGDVHQAIGTLFQAARLKKTPALALLQGFREDFKRYFKDDENLDSPEGVEKFTESEAFQRSVSGTPLIAFLGAAIFRQAAYKTVLERRAARSALFVSSGQPLARSALSGERDKGGAKVQELRTARSLEPEAITHVLLPATLAGFVPLLQQIRPDVDMRPVETTAEPIQVGYYNDESRTRTSVDIRVPNYQKEIDQLRAEHGNLLTHITNID